MELKLTMLSPFLSLIGGAVLLVVGLVGSQAFQGYYYGIPPIANIFAYINGGVSAVWAGLAIYGAVLAFRENENGKKFMLIAAIGGIIGTFIPIYIWDVNGWTQMIKLNGSAMFIDVVLILIGAILGYSLTEREPPKE